MGRTFETALFGVFGDRWLGASALDLPKEFGVREIGLERRLKVVNLMASN
jgi:hypothetical protein